jgi:hypothetical protein
MTTTINSPLVESLVTLVRELAIARPETVYRPCWSEKSNSMGRCSYLAGACSDGSVGCLLGQALLALGFTTDHLQPVNHLGIKEALEKLHPCQLTDHDYDQVRWLETVQSAQDNGQTWQEAVERADEEEPLRISCSTLVHEHEYGQTLYGFYFEASRSLPYPSVLRVVQALGVDYDRSVGEHVSLHTIEGGEPDRILMADAVGSREPEPLDMSE